MGWKKIKLFTSGNCVLQAYQYIEFYLKQDSFYQKQKKTICIILDEILSNITKYAYGSNMGKILVYFKKTNQKNILKLCFVDWGGSFNPLRNVSSDITTEIEKKRIGGLGIYIVLKLARHVKYKRRGFKNILLIEIGEAS